MSLYLLNTTFRAYFIPTDENLNLTLNDKIYIGEYADLASNYKTTYLLKTNKINGAIAGAPKLGEILGSAPIKCYSEACTNIYWLMSDKDASNAYISHPSAVDGHTKTNNYSVLPTIYISNEGIILSGSGTKSSPFVLGGQ